MLRHWPFYERNINKLTHSSKRDAINLFKSLKNLEYEELKLISERYYKSDKLCNFNNKMGDYETVNPMTTLVIADKIGQPYKKVVEDLKCAERKVGQYFTEFKQKSRGENNGF